MPLDTFNLLMYSWIGLALILIPFQLKTIAPYGRHSRNNWGPMIDNRLGWILMEIFSPAVFAFFFLTGSNEKTFPMWVFFSLWMLHYTNRSLIFPFRTRTSGKKMPLMIALSAIFFNLMNGFTNGYYLGVVGPVYTIEWLQDPRFIIGLVVFISGAIINLQADNILINLRKPGEKGYKIPFGGFFRWISCPNHFGEMIEWTGFAIMCWNLPALGFAIWTIANLLPRALAHHRWYLNKFSGYPKERKAVFPHLL